MSRGPRSRTRVFIGALAVAIPLVWSDAGLAAAAANVDKVQEFSLDQVQITDAYQKNLFSKDVTYLITTLDADRLLAGFKAVSTGANPTNLYGGWENTNIRGHTMGHWLSAMAHAYQQALGSDPTLAGQIKTKLDDVISKLKTYQLSSGYLFATPISQFNDFDAGTGSTWVPYYTMHKILAGLVDVYKLEKNADALAIASKMGDWLYARATGWSASAKSRVLSQEYGGMNDALYELYKYTNVANHLTVAHIFDDTGLFTTTAAGTDTLNGKHANTTIPKFIGALNRYRTVGTSEQSYFTAADQFLSIVLKSHTYVTGGNSEDEHFHVPGQLDANRDAVNNETCNAYNMSKLTRDLFKVTADAKYANYYEKVHINEILASMNPETGMTTYFKAMGTGYFKVFGGATDRFWCCTGTGMENFSKLGDSVYFHSDKDLWVAGYVSSTLNWKERGLSLTQTTDLPLTSKATFTVTAAPTDAVNLQFRKPDWIATCQIGITVNGQPVTPVTASGFLGVSRVWQANDEIELSFPLLVQVSRLQDNQNAVAFTYGPLVLSAGLGTDSMTTVGHGVQVLAATRPSGIKESIAIKSGTTINDWLANIQSNLVQTPGKLEFTLKNTDSDGTLVFVPHYSRYKDRYGIYWKLTGAAGGTASTTVVCPPTGAGGSTGGGGAGGGAGGAGSTGTGTGGTGGSVVSTGNGGSVGSGGSGVSTGGGGPSSSGGTSGPGGVSGGAAGSSARGGSGGSASGGAPGANGGSTSSGVAGHGDSGAGGRAPTTPDSASGCACAASQASGTSWGTSLLFGLAMAELARRRRQRAE
jgi:DUF1680 family protein